MSDMAILQQLTRQNVPNVLCLIDLPNLQTYHFSP
jgi:hypothetical protein